MINTEEYTWNAIGQKEVVTIESYIRDLPSVFRNLSPSMYKLIITNFDCSSYFDDIFFISDGRKRENPCSSTGFMMGSKTRALLDIAMDYLDTGIYVIDKNPGLIQYDDYKSFFHDVHLLDDVEDLKSVDFK
jgi:hypothetical protein